MSGRVANKSNRKRSERGKQHNSFTFVDICLAICLAYSNELYVWWQRLFFFLSYSFFCVICLFSLSSTLLVELADMPSNWLRKGKWHVFFSHPVNFLLGYVIFIARVSAMLLEKWPWKMVGGIFFPLLLPGVCHYIKYSNSNENAVESSANCQWDYDWITPSFGESLDTFSPSSAILLFRRFSHTTFRRWMVMHSIRESQWLFDNTQFGEKFTRGYLSHNRPSILYD